MLNLTYAKSYFQKTVDIVLPHYCLSCQDIISHEKGFCTNCWTDLKFVPEQICEICGYMFEVLLQDEKPICLSCQQNKPHFDEARSVWVYNQLTKKLVLQFKYADRIDLAKYFAHYFLLLGEEFFSNIDIICPVPLHWQRQWKRGYNQAALLSYWLFEHLHNSPYQIKNISLTQDLLSRIKKTNSQGHFSLEKRQRNIKNAFQIPTKYKNSIAGKVILLIDDVYTTGATANEAARILKEGLAKKVYILTLMRVGLRIY